MTAMTIGRILVTLLLLLTRCVGIDASPQAPRAALRDARDRAYTANARNDTGALARALATFEGLSAGDKDVLAVYYASWTAWSLAGSQIQAGNADAAKASAGTAVRYARLGLSLRPDSAEFQAMAANALIGLAVIDGTTFQALLPDIAAARAKAVELGPRNPRVVMMDAGMIFNIPPERGGSQEKGIARFLEALARFDEEHAAAAPDDLQPRWGRDLAHGWLAAMYLRLTPPAIEKARAEADIALRLRPDFWYVKQVVLPQLKDAR